MHKIHTALILLITVQIALPFTVIPENKNLASSLARNGRLFAENKNNNVDVSDLGLTMDDLSAPIPPELLGIDTSGYESTSRIPSVQDDSCMWTEDSNTVQATLAIPGLRGQPSACLAVLFATQTVSVSAFGRIVWSCILRGEIEPEASTFETLDGPEMVPVIELQVTKANPTGERWGGFILQVGEDSIL